MCNTSLPFLFFHSFLFLLFQHLNRYIFLLFPLVSLSINLTIEGSMNAVSFLIKNRNFIGFESCFEKSDEFFPIIIMTRNNEKL